MSSGQPTGCWRYHKNLLSTQNKDDKLILANALLPKKRILISTSFLARLAAFR
jgi:hypothetical protein